MSSWNPFRDSWSDWSNDPSKSGSTRNQMSIQQAEEWRRTHSIDPRTGDLLGSPGLIPGQYGLEFQLQHEIGRDYARQQRMRSASNYARGALGLLQSFRPGGGATLEAGQYNALAQIEQNRAQMLQPLDLLGDYRRDQQARSEQKSNRAREASTYVQLAALAVSALAGGVAAGAAGAAAGGILGGLGGILGGLGGQGGGGTMSDDFYRQSQSQTATAVRPEGYQPIGNQGMGSGEQQQLQQDERGTAQAGLQPYGQEDGPGPTQQPMGGQQASQGKGQGVPGESPGGPQGAGGAGGGMAGMGGPMVGADGVFTPVAYAAAAASSQIDPMQGVIMSRALANNLESDPAWGQISFAIDQRLQMRTLRSRAA